MKQKLLLLALILISCIGSMNADDYVPDMTKAMSITVNDLDKDEFTVKRNQYTVTSAVVDGKSFSATFNNETAGGWTTGRNDYVANPEGKAINFNVRAQLKKNTTVSMNFPRKGYLYIYGYGYNSDVTLSTGKIDDQTIQVATTKESMPTAEDASITVKGYVTNKFIALKGKATLYIDSSESVYFYGFCFVPDENIDLNVEAKPYAAYKDGTLTFLYDDKWADSEEDVFWVYDRGYLNWSDVAETTTKVVFDPSFAGYTGLESTSYWFRDFIKLETVTGLENLNTQNVTNMNYMFYGCSGLQSLDVGKFNTQNVTNMNCMFYGCSSLQSLDLSKFDTQNVTSMGYMFYGCSSLQTLDVSNFNTENVTSMYNMFYGCSSLKSLDVSNFNTQNVTSMGYMFYGCSSLKSLDVSKFDTQKVTSMYNMFYGCSSLKSLDVSNFNTQNVTSMGYMFYGCSSLKSLDISNFNTGNVTSMGYTFCDCSGLQTLDVSKFNTQNVTNMGGMFYNCSGLSSLDVSKFDTQNVTSMGGMFYNCSGLQTLDVSKFNTQKVISIASMFYGCSGLSLLDLRSFSTESLKEATDLYAACKDDLQVLLPEGWNVDAMTRIASFEPIGNFLYNIYKDSHAVLAYRKESVTISGDMVVPSKIEYQGEEYNVTKVGRISYAAETLERNLFTILSDEEYLKVTSITFEDGIEEIDDNYLGMYVHAASINIPKSVKNISPATYRQQSVRNFLYVDENGRFLSDVTFNVDKDNPVYTSVDGVLYDKEMKTLLRCPRNKTGEFVVPEGVEALAWSAFRSCGQLESVVLPVGLKTVGEENATSGVFNECYKLAKINIPSTVEYMSYQAFYTNSSSGLKEIFCYITEPKGYDEEAMNLFRDYSRPTFYVPFGTKEKYLAAEGWKNFENIVEMKDELIVNNVISGNYMYTLYNEDYHAEIEGIVNSLSGDVVVPATVKYKGEKYSVKNVNSLTTLYYYDETENKYHYVKYSSIYGYDENIPAPDFTNVTSITFEDGIESISDNNLCAYWYCKVVNIPASVKYISPETYYMRYMSGSGYSDDTRYSTNTGMLVLFNDITYNVDAENKVYSSLDGVLYDKEKKTLLRCPRGWEGLFKVPDGVEVIDRFGFFFCPLITEIQLPSSVRVLGDEGGDWTFQARLFGACYSLEKINIPEGVERIESNSFRNCISLKGLTLPNSLKYYNTTALASNIAMEYLDWQDCELETLDVNVGYPILSTAGTQCKISLPKNVKNIVCTDRYGYQSTGTLFTGGIVPEILTLPASIEKFEATQLFSTSFNSTTLAPLKKLYVLMGFMPDISENFFGYDEVRVGRTTTQQFPQTWADQCTLYVPENLVDAYRAHAVWGKFPNIVGVEVVRDIDPITEETTIAFEENDFVNGDNTPVDLNNTVINDTYFSINNNGDADGFFDKEEQCIVINKQTSNEAMQTVVASELGSSDFISNFTGMVIEVNGRGSIKVNAQTIGNSMVAVKIGNGEAKTFAKATKGNIIENYDVSENTYVYIYATDEANQAQSLSMSTTTSTADNAVKIFSITVTPEATAVGEVTSAMLESALSKMYSVEGKPLASPQKGINILKMTDGTTRKVVK